MTVYLDVLPDAPRALKRRDRLRLYAGTAEVLATLLPLGVDHFEPGESGFAQMYLQSPVVTTWNQPFVLRAESTVATVAGGRVMVPAARKLRKPTAAVLQRLDSLRSEDLVARAAAAVYFGALPLAQADDLARIAGSDDPTELLRQLVDAKLLISLLPSGQRQLMLPAALLDDYAERVAALLAHWHDQFPLKSSFDRTKLIHEFSYLGEPIILQSLLQRMDRQKRLRLTDRSVGLADRGPQLSRGEQQLMEQLIERYRTARFQPPSVKECEQAATKNQKSVRSLLALAASDGALVEFGDQMYLHADCERELRTVLRDRFAAAGELTVSEIRETLDTSRKFAVPLCEYLDRIGFTQRHGDTRRFNPNFAASGQNADPLSVPQANG